jgi:hypothetical protein
MRLHLRAATPEATAAEDSTPRPRAVALAADPVADRAVAVLEEGRTAAPRAADTITAKRFSPRFTPHLTHRQEAPSKGPPVLLEK